MGWIQPKNSSVLDCLEPRRAIPLGMTKRASMDGVKFKGWMPIPILNYLSTGHGELCIPHLDTFKFNKLLSTILQVRIKLIRIHRSIEWLVAVNFQTHVKVGRSKEGI